MMYLPDTTVVAELRKPDPDPRVLAWYSTVTSAEIYISALTMGEIRLGVEQLRRKDATQADLLEQWLPGLDAGYGDHVIDVDAAAAEEWGRLSVPDSLPVIGGLLAASAKIPGWALVTPNTAGVAPTGGARLQPFE